MGSCRIYRNCNINIFFYSRNNIIVRSGFKDSRDLLQFYIPCKCFIDGIISHCYTKKKIPFHKGRFVIYLNIGELPLFLWSVINIVLDYLRKSTPFMFLPSFLNQMELILRDFPCNNKSLLFRLVLEKWRLSGSRIYFHFTTLLQASNNKNKNNVSKAIIRDGGGSPLLVYEKKPWIKSSLHKSWKIRDTEGESSLGESCSDQPQGNTVRPLISPDQELRKYTRYKIWSASFWFSGSIIPIFLVFHFKNSYSVTHQTHCLLPL